VTYAPGAKGLAATVQTNGRGGVSGADGSGVTTSLDGWVYELNVPHFGMCT
jgi:hypothetical protein